MHPTYPTKCAYVQLKVDECKPLVRGFGRAVTRRYNTFLSGVSAKSRRAAALAPHLILFAGGGLVIVFLPIWLRSFVRKREVVASAMLLIPTYLTISALEGCRSLVTSEGASGGGGGVAALRGSAANGAMGSPVLGAGAGKMTGGSGRRLELGPGPGSGAGTWAGAGSGALTSAGVGEYASEAAAAAEAWLRFWVRPGRDCSPPHSKRCEPSLVESVNWHLKTRRAISARPYL